MVGMKVLSPAVRKIAADCLWDFAPGERENADS